MSNSTRRQFLNQAGQLTLGAALLPNVSRAQTAGDARFKIALSQYSLRAMIKDGSLDPLDFPAFTIDTFGIEAIDLWEGGLPAEKLDDADYLVQMKNRAVKAGTELFLLMGGAFDVEQSKRDVSFAALKQSLKRTEHLGCELLRIFLKAPGGEMAPALAASVEALKPLADLAAEKNRIIVIEPGASPLSQQGAFLAEVAKTLNHPACRLMPDFGKLKDNVYDGTEAMLPYTETISCKMHSFNEAGNQPDFDYPRLIKMIADSDYRGYLAIEWEGTRLQPIEGVKASQRLLEKSLAAL